LVCRAGTLCQVEFFMSLFRNNRYSQKKMPSLIKQGLLGSMNNQSH
jgi:hypothetical protein